MNSHRTWTAETLRYFVLNMQLRMCYIMRDHDTKFAVVEGRPYIDEVFRENLQHEVAFTLHVVGHCVLMGIKAPQVTCKVLNGLGYVLGNPDNEGLGMLRKAMTNFVWLHERSVDGKWAVALPRWWETNDGDAKAFDVSAWVVEKVSLDREMQALDSVDKRMEKVLALLDEQADFAHRYWSAAAEDVVSSARDWAAVHSAIRSRIGMRYEGVPSIERFKGGRTANAGENGGQMSSGRQ